MKKTIEDTVLESHPNMILRKPKPKTKRYSFRIYIDYLEMAKIQAVEKRMSVSQIINQALIKFLGE